MNFGQLAQSKQAFISDTLQATACQLRSNPYCASAHYVPTKQTIHMKMVGGLKVDLAMGNDDYRAVKFSRSVRQKLDAAESAGHPRCGIRRLCRVVLAWARQQCLCHRSSASIQRPKSVHWTLLVWALTTMPRDVDDAAWEFAVRRGIAEGGLVSRFAMDASLTEAFAAVMEKLRWYPFEDVAIDVGEDGPRLFNRMNPSDGQNLFPKDYIVLLKDVYWRTNICSKFTVDGESKHGGLARLREQASITAQGCLGAGAEAFWQTMAAEWTQQAQLFGPHHRPRSAPAPTSSDGDDDEDSPEEAPQSPRFQQSAPSWDAGRGPLARLLHPAMQRAAAG